MRLGPSLITWTTRMISIHRWERSWQTGLLKCTWNLNCCQRRSTWQWTWSIDSWARLKSTGISYSSSVWQPCLSRQSTRRSTRLSYLTSFTSQTMPTPGKKSFRWSNICSLPSSSASTSPLPIASLSDSCSSRRRVRQRRTSLFLC